MIQEQHLPIQFHAFHPSALNPPRLKAIYLLLEVYSGAAGVLGRFTERFSLRRLQPDLLCHSDLVTIALTAHHAGSLCGPICKARTSPVLTDTDAPAGD